jgi:hypothetical protein
LSAHAASIAQAAWARAAPLPSDVQLYVLVSSLRHGGPSLSGAGCTDDLAADQLTPRRRCAAGGL